jgi:hypothetical protein
VEMMRKNGYLCAGKKAGCTPTLQVGPATRSFWFVVNCWY